VKVVAQVVVVVVASDKWVFVFFSLYVLFFFIAVLDSCFLDIYLLVVWSPSFFILARFIRSDLECCPQQQRFPHSPPNCHVQQRAKKSDWP